MSKNPYTTTEQARLRLLRLKKGVTYSSQVHLPKLLITDNGNGKKNLPISLDFLVQANGSQST